MLASLDPHVFFRPTPPKPDAAFRWSVDVAVGSSVTVWRSQYSSDWSHTPTVDEEELALGFLSAGVADMLIGTKHVQRTPTTAAVLAMSRLRDHRVKTVDGRYANVLLRFDASMVSKVLSSMYQGARLSTLDIAPLVELSTDVGQILHQIAHAIVSGLHDRQLLMRSPKAAALLTEAALHLIFANVPHRLIGQLDRCRPGATPRHVERAIDYMHANLHLPLTITDIANAIGISDRLLQLEFRKFRDTSPIVYLRRIRLDAVHAELSQPENELPVREVALKWGFTHIGRFAAQYRDAFGLYPSETVKRTSRRR
jgi:AraC-like DNA-binding protein